MEDGMEDGKAWSNQYGFDCSGQMDYTFGSSSSLPSVWPAEFHGLENEERFINIRNSGAPSFFQVTSALLPDAATATTELDAMARSNINALAGAEMQLVPFGHTNDGGQYIAPPRNNVEHEPKIMPDAGADPFLQPASNGNNEKSSTGGFYLPTDAWDEKVKVFENMIASFRGLHTYTREVEGGMFKIASVACNDSLVMSRVASFIPSSMITIARNAACDKTQTDGYSNAGSTISSPGVEMPHELSLVLGSIGITCQDRETNSSVSMDSRMTIPPACTHPHCSQNRYPAPDPSEVWKFTNWLEHGASADDLKRVLYEPEQHIYGKKLQAVDFKDFIRGNDLGVDMLAAFMVLLGENEGKAFKENQMTNTRHFVDPEWGTSVASGILRGNASIRKFFRRSTPYRLTAEALVMAPVCVQRRWTCYAMDFGTKKISVLDPNTPMLTKPEILFHEKNVHIVLDECVRCMRYLAGDTTVGSGKWSGSIMLAKDDESTCVSMKDPIGPLTTCIMGFNSTFVCDTDNKLCEDWARRKLAYCLANLPALKQRVSAAGTKRGALHDIDRSSEK